MPESKKSRLRYIPDPIGGFEIGDNPMVNAEQLRDLTLHPFGHGNPNLKGLSIPGMKGLGMSFTHPEEREFDVY